MGRTPKSADEPKKPSKQWELVEGVKILTYMKETILKGLELNVILFSLILRFQSNEKISETMQKSLP